MTFDFGGTVEPGETVAPLDVSGAAAFALTPTVTVVVKAGGLVAGKSYPLMTWGSTSGTAPTSALLAGDMSGTASLTVVGSTLFLSLDGATPPPVFSGKAVTISGGAPTLNFDTVAGFKYGLDYRTSMTTGFWQSVICPPDFPPPDGWSAISTGAPMTLTDTNAMGQQQRFYRLKATPP